MCTLGPGTTFGESILTGKPRHATVVTKDYTELIRVEQKDFKILWDVSMNNCVLLNMLFLMEVLKEKKKKSGLGLYTCEMLTV